MAVTTRELQSDIRLGISAQTPEAVEPKRIPAIKLWAYAGVLILAFQAYVIINWVTGPYFKRVPQGPSQPPDWMKAELIAWQVFSIPVALGLIYWFFVRPWRRERRVGVDGLIAVAAISLSFQDPLSAWAQPWFTYNSYMINFGSWVAGMPGMSAFHAPGAMVQEPILFTTAAYVYAFLAAAALGSFAMRRARARWPRISWPSLIGICFATMAVFDIVLEGVIWLPLGVFEYPGGHWALFGQHSYHKYPVQELVTVCGAFTAVACLRFFLNDRGQSVVERGLDEVKGSAGRKIGLRLLATITFVNLAMFCCYTIPNTLLSINQPSWPKDLQQRSYLTNFVCGAGTNRVCPGPATPIVRQGGAYLGPNGQLVVPNGVKLPEIYPFKQH
jgi:hypothetical protein